MSTKRLQTMLGMMIKDKKVSNIALYNTTQYQVGFLGTLGNVDKEEN